MANTVVTFGEIMLRLAPPGFERFLQSPQFVATFGGGEANVAVAVAMFGLPARYLTVIPPPSCCGKFLQKFGSSWVIAITTPLSFMRFVRKMIVC